MVFIIWIISFGSRKTIPLSSPLVTQESQPTHDPPNGANAEVWHQRLGHANDEAILQLADRVMGVRIKAPRGVFCEPFRVATAKLQISRVLRPTPGSILDTVAIDFHDFLKDSDA